MWIPQTPTSQYIYNVSYLYKYESVYVDPQYDYQSEKVSSIMECIAI